MFGKIVVGVGGTGESRDALRLATVLSELFAAEVLLVHAYPSDPYEAAIVLGDTGHPLKDAAEELLVAEARHAPRAARTLAVKGSSPARVLHHVAEQEGADLLIVASSRHGRVGRVLLGDDARQSMHHAPCAVAIAPRGYASETRGVASVGVGFDASADARRALAAAAEIAQRASARMTLAAALAPPFEGAVAYTYPYPVDWSSYYGELGARLREEIGRAIAELPVEADGDVREGWPPKMLEELSRSVDLLVVGSRHWGTVNRLMLGSTSTALVGRAHCPLLVVPRGPDEG